MSFNTSTRQNFTTLPKQNYSAGNRLYFELPPVGLLSRLFLVVKGTMTLAPGTGSIALSDRLAYNLIKRIKILANSGTAIYDVSGFGTYIVNHFQRIGTAPDKTIVDRTIGTEVYSAPIQTGDNAWIMGLEIPIAMDENSLLGMILLQNNATQLVLEVEFNAAGGANNLIAPIVLTGNATASFVGTTEVMMEYFTVPKEKKDYPPINVIHQWLEQQDAITSTGENVKSLIKGNTFMRLVHYLTLVNALDTTDVSKLKIVYNQSETPYQISKEAQLFLQRKRYGMDLPKGVFCHDYAMTPSSRDFINSANVTEFQSIIDIASGATVTAGQSFINTLSEQLIMMG